MENNYENYSVEDSEKRHQQQKDQGDLVMFTALAMQSYIQLSRHQALSDTQIAQKALSVARTTLALLKNQKL